jgi:hypothetical protein
MEEIINKVANSALEVFDLEDYYQKVFDLRLTFHNGFWRLFIERKNFLEHLKKSRLDTVSGSVCGSQLQYGRHCSGMASILVTIQLAPFAKKINGNIDDLNAALYEELLAKITRRMLINNY